MRPTWFDRVGPLAREVKMSEKSASLTVTLEAVTPLFLGGVEVCK